MERRTELDAVGRSIFLTSPEIQERIITSNKLVFAFPTNIPITPGHILICPKRAVKTVYELTPDELQAMFAMMETLKPAIQKEFGASGFNYAWNEGESGWTISTPCAHSYGSKKR